MVSPFTLFFTSFYKIIFINLIFIVTQLQNNLKTFLHFFIHFFLLRGIVQQLCWNLFKIMCLTGDRQHCSPSFWNWGQLYPGNHFKVYNITSFIPLSTMGRFVVFRVSWAPLCPNFWLENLTSWSTELYKMLSSFSWLLHPTYSPQKGGKSWASIIELNSP
jgi:hypothetical protein